MTRDEVIAAIDGITEQMKGPLPNVERTLLHLDRKDLRAALTQMDATPEGTARDAK